MNKPLIIIKERTINATPSEIWEVITTPQYFDEWMFVPGKVTSKHPFGLGSKIQWVNDENIAYLEGTVISFIPNQKIVISLQDISWNKIVPQGSVTYEFHLTRTENGTKIRFYLGDLAVDPEGQEWYDAYNSSDEIGSIENVILANNRQNKND